MELDRGGVLIPGFIRALPTLALHGVAHSLLAGSVAAPKEPNANQLITRKLTYQLPFSAKYSPLLFRFVFLLTQKRPCCSFSRWGAMTTDIIQ